MPHADPEARRRYMTERARRLRGDPTEKGERFRQSTRTAALKYRHRNLERIRLADAAKRRLQRRFETREEHEARLAKDRAYRSDEFHEFNNLMGRLRARRLTLDQYHAILERQDFACAICEEPFDFGLGMERRRSGIHLDHCHSTNCVRGLLCGACNVGIGHLRESPELFQRAAAYVTRHKLRAREPFIDTD
jgi:hypothetical protein